MDSLNSPKERCPTGPCLKQSKSLLEEYPGDYLDDPANEGPREVYLRRTLIYLIRERCYVHWTIILNGGKVDVDENLEAALHEISTQGHLIRIWVNTIYIN